MSEDSRAGLTTEIPMTFRRRAGKAVIVLPNGERAVERREALIDNTMVKLIARGHRWHRKLFDGIARALSISKGVVAKYLRLAVDAGLGWPLPEDLDDTALERRLYQQSYRRVRESRKTRLK